MDCETLERLTRRPEDYEEISELWIKFINIGEHGMMSNLDFYILLSNYQSELTESSISQSEIVKSTYNLPTNDRFERKSDYLFEPEIQTKNNQLNKSTKLKTPSLPPHAFKKIRLGSGSFAYQCTINDCKKRFTRKAENAKSHW
jgi:hypothetical protein